MSIIENVYFTGASDKVYNFTAHSIPSEYRNAGGVYIFTRRNFIHNKVEYIPLYIGESHSISERLSKHHEKWQCAINNNVDSICVYYVAGGKSVRKVIEADLLRNRKPPCNG